MSQNATITRPLAVVSESLVSAQGVDATLVGTNATYLDYTATIDSELRLLYRIKLTREIQGSLQRYKIEHLDFTSTADQTFTAGAVVTPFTDAEADKITVVEVTPWVDMNVLYTTAGEPPSS